MIISGVGRRAGIVPMQVLLVNLNLFVNLTEKAQGLCFFGAEGRAD